jgi:hypothetical protein
MRKCQVGIAYNLKNFNGSGIAGYLSFPDEISKKTLDG